MYTPSSPACGTYGTPGVYTEWYMEGCIQGCTIPGLRQKETFLKKAEKSKPLGAVSRRKLRKVEKSWKLVSGRFWCPDTFPKSGHFSDTFLSFQQKSLNNREEERRFEQFEQKSRKRAFLSSLRKDLKPGLNQALTRP